MEKSLRTEAGPFPGPVQARGSYAVRAHSILGELACKQGRYAKSLPHLMFATVSAVSKIASALAAADPSWKFAGMRTFLREVDGNEAARSYAESVKLEAILYYLGLSLFKGGQDKQGREIMAGPGGAKGDWGALAASSSWSKPALSPEPDPEIVF
jgi:hypothetical protein